MREALAEIASIPLGDNPLLGPEFVPAMAARLESLSGRGPVSARVEMQILIARTKLWSGKNEEAVELLQSTIELTEELPANERSAASALARFWLGVAHLRDGENKNCIHAHSSQSCIVPLEGGGIHVDKDPGYAAIESLTELLETPELEDWLTTGATWLLNIAYMTVGEYPDGVAVGQRVSLPVASGFRRFRQVADQLGLGVFDLAGGVVVDDFNRDSFLDVLFSSFHVESDLRLFLNDGDGGFYDASEKAGIKGLAGGLNMVQADYNNDGHVDVLVLRGAWLGERGRHPNSLLRNQGDGTFVDVTFESGLAEANYPTQAGAWADYDLDGDVDLYVGNEMRVSDSGRDPYPHQLFRNNGDGTFSDVAAGAGFDNRYWTKAVSWGDVDDDGFPDLFVSNLDGPNSLYRNRGDGTFEDIAASAGVTEPSRSFGTWFWDFDNDGALDLFVGDYAVESPVSSKRRDLGAVAAGLLGRGVPPSTSRLYRGDGEGGFKDVTATTGLVRTTFPMGLNFGDLDNDGFLDFYLATGYPGLDGLIPNVMYQNVGGLRFRDVTTAGGFGHLQKGHGVAFADIDNDGDQDIVNQLGGFYTVDRFANAVYENPGFGRRWIRLKLEGRRSNRSAIGARIRVDINEDGRKRSIYRWVGSGATFGCNPLRSEIGLGEATQVDRIEIRWPGVEGAQVFTNLAADRSYHVREGEDVLLVR